MEDYELVRQKEKELDEKFEKDLQAFVKQWMENNKYNNVDFIGEFSEGFAIVKAKHKGKFTVAFSKMPPIGASKREVDSWSKKRWIRVFNNIIGYSRLSVFERVQF